METDVNRALGESCANGPTVVAVPVAFTPSILISSCRMEFEVAGFANPGWVRFSFPRGNLRRLSRVPCQRTSAIAAKITAPICQFSFLSNKEGQVAVAASRRVRPMK